MKAYGLYGSLLNIGGALMGLAGVVSFLCGMALLSIVEVLSGAICLVVGMRWVGIYNQSIEEFTKKS